MEYNIATLEKATRVDLLEQWRFLINRPPPKHISRRLLIQILAWERRCQTKPNTSQSAIISKTYEAQIWNHSLRAVVRFCL